MDDWLFLILPIVFLAFGTAVFRELASVWRKGFNIMFLLAFTFWIAVELILVLMWLKLRPFEP
jgi:tellurite resistance protein TehA-like permease